MKVLIVEDDQVVANGLMRVLEPSEYEPYWASNGKHAQTMLEVKNPDLILMDLGLPDMDGLELMLWIRRTNPMIPILVITARDKKHDMIMGLDSGADDYMAKPFDIEELLAKLRVHKRRLSYQRSDAIVVKKLKFSAHSLEAKIDGIPIPLAHKEAMILKALLLNVNCVKSRSSLEKILSEWGEEVSSNAIDVHIHNLRKKIGSDYIKTIRGIGYLVSSDEIH